MTYYGLGLLPTEDTADKLKSFRKKNLDILGKVEPFTPHVTILQAPLRDNEVDGRFLDIIKYLWDCVGATDSSFGDLYLENGSWVFLEVLRNTWLQDLHNECIDVFRGRINHQELSNVNTGSFKGLPRQNMLDFGYPYLGEDFTPHITLGFNESPRLSRLNDIFDESQARFQGSPLDLSTLVLYRMGNLGTVQKILHRF